MDLSEHPDGSSILDPGRRRSPLAPFLAVSGCVALAEFSVEF